MKKRINMILVNDTYRDCLKQIEECEKERQFCRHDIAHFLDVARIAMILKLEEKIKIKEELIYATALLHDIGRHEQYRNCIPHEIASANIAVDILKACKFSEDENCQVISAIENHREWKRAKLKQLDSIIYRADKMSRACFACPAEAICDWGNKKKNLILIK